VLITGIIALLLLVRLLGVVPVLIGLAGGLTRQW